MLTALATGAFTTPAIVLLSSHPDPAVIAGRAVLGFGIIFFGLNLVYYLMDRVAARVSARQEAKLLGSGDDAD